MAQIIDTPRKEARFPLLKTIYASSARTDIQARNRHATDRNSIFHRRKVPWASEGRRGAAQLICIFIAIRRLPASDPPGFTARFGNRPPGSPRASPEDLGEAARATLDRRPQKSVESVVKHGPPQPRGRKSDVFSATRLRPGRENTYDSTPECSKHTRLAHFDSDFTANLSPGLGILDPEAKPQYFIYKLLIPCIRYGGGGVNVWRSSVDWALQATPL